MYRDGSEKRNGMKMQGKACSYEMFISKHCELIVPAVDRNSSDERFESGHKILVEGQ